MQETPTRARMYKFILSSHLHKLLFLWLLPKRKCNYPMMLYLELYGDCDVIKQSVRLPQPPPLGLDVNLVAFLEQLARRPHWAAKALVVVEHLLLAAVGLLQVDGALKRVAGNVHQEAV